MSTATRTKTNLRQEIKQIRRELTVIRSFMIGTLGRDPEGSYRPEFVERVLRASQETPIYEYTGKGSLLKLLKDL